MSQAELFHLIADRDCAEVRKLLVDQSLTAHISFRNVHYESNAEALIKITGTLDVPVLHLLDSGQVLAGKSSILEYLKTVRWPKK